MPLYGRSVATGSKARQTIAMTVEQGLSGEQHSPQLASIRKKGKKLAKAKNGDNGGQADPVSAADTPEGTSATLPPSQPAPTENRSPAAAKSPAAKSLANRTERSKKLSAQSTLAVHSAKSREDTQKIAFFEQRVLLMSAGHVMEDIVKWEKNALSHPLPKLD